MSCDYDLHCVDCNEFLGVSDWNHGDDDLARLWSARKELATLAGLMPVLDEVLHVEHSYRGPFWIGFFAKHRDHNVRIRNEYGQYLGDCREYVPCGCCGHRFPCRLAHGHEGAHSPKAST